MWTSGQHQAEIPSENKSIPLLPPAARTEMKGHNHAIHDEPAPKDSEKSQRNHNFSLASLDQFTGSSGSGARAQAQSKQYNDN